VQYVGIVVSQRDLYEWIEWFQNARTRSEDEEEAGNQPTSVSVEYVKRMRDTIMQNRWVTADEGTNQSEIGHGYHGPETEGNGACGSCLSVRNFLF
jgi:thiamine pyrophosphate-dependent acetolactate synthase large subunit-like protein